MNSDKKVSYILITYNRVNDLVECIQSIKEQRYKNIEIILVDNNSNDGTSKIINEKYSEVQLIQSSLNLGVPGARNLGIRRSSGEILVFIDDDCLIKDNRLTEKILEYFEDKSNLGILAFKVINYFTNRIDRLAFPHTDKTLIESEFETSYFYGAGHAIKRDVIDKTGMLFDEYFYGFEELDYSWRAMSEGFRIWYSPQLVVYHKTSPTARPTWRSVYYFTRNRIWLVYSFLPLKYILSHLVIWLPYYFITSIRIKRIDKFFLGLKDGILNIRNLNKRRRRFRLCKKDIRNLKALKGRLSY